MTPARRSLDVLCDRLGDGILDGTVPATREAGFPFRLRNLGLELLAARAAEARAQEAGFPEGLRLARRARVLAERRLRRLEREVRATLRAPAALLLEGREVGP